MQMVKAYQLSTYLPSLLSNSTRVEAVGRIE